MDCLKLKIGPWIVLENELSLHLERSGDINGEVLTAPNGQTVVKNNRILESEVVEECAEPEAMNNPSIKTFQEIPSKINLSEEEKKLSLLRNALHLDIESQTEYKNQHCLVHSIFVKRGKGANALEKLFTFIVILKEEFVADNPSKLWQKIRDKVHDWMKLLTKEKREEFQWNDDSESFLHLPSNENVSLRGKGKVVQVFLDHLSDIDFQKTVFVVLVDKQLFKSRQTARYLFKMDKQPKHSFVLKLNGNESKYHASFDLEHSSQDLVYSKHFKVLLEGVGDLLTQPPLGPPEEPYPQSSRQVQTLRPFGDEVSSNFFYQKGFVLNAWETGPKDLMDPVHEFKLCHKGKLDESNLLDKFLFETLRFACGCLNERTNGTIHFGVADEERKQAGNCEPRQVVGCRVSSKPTLSKKLTEYIDKCFVGDSRGIVRNCIRPPLFIPVKGDEVSRDESVIEVDIEPQITLCKGKIFMTNFNCLIRGGNEEAAYIRHGSESKVIKNCKEFRDVAERLPTLDELRKKQERKNMFVKHLYRKVVILFNENRVRLQRLQHLVIDFSISLFLYLFIVALLSRANLIARKKLTRKKIKQWRGRLKETMKLMYIRPPQLFLDKRR